MKEEAERDKYHSLDELSAKHADSVKQLKKEQEQFI